MENLLGVPMNVIAGALAAAFVVGVGALAVTAWRNRLLFVLAVRGVPRRRAQSLLITLGLALGTVIMTTALNTGDTMSHTVRSLVAGTVGRTDEVIVRPRRDARRTGFDAVQSVVSGTFLTGSLSLFDQAEYERIAAAVEGDERIAGLTPAIVELVIVSNLSNAELQNQVRLLALPGDYPPVFGSLVSVGGEPLWLGDLPAGQVIANADAALALQASVGDRLRVHYGERAFELVLGAIVRTGELGGAQPAVIVPLDQLQALAGQPRQINQILVANRGDRVSSVNLSQEVARALRPLLVDDATAARLHAFLRRDAARAGLEAVLSSVDPRERPKLEALLRELERDVPSPEFVALISDPDLERRVAILATRSPAFRGGSAGLPGAPGSLRVVEIKRLSQELADRWGGALTTVFVVLGLFSIATGVMLVILIFSLLAAERRSEMGTTRALGARRRHLILMFLYEGLFYDLVASAVGLAIGVGAGAILVSASASLLSGFGIELQPRVEPRSLLIAYCAGAVITMVSIAYGAWRASRLTIVAAIRNLPDPPAHPARRAAIATGPGLLVVGAGLVWPGLQGSWSLPLGVGVILIVLGLAFSARSTLGRAGLDARRADRLVFTAGGLALLAYWLAPSDVMAGYGLRPLPRSMDLFFLAGLSLVLGSVWIVTFNLDLIARVVRLIGDRRRGGGLLARTALAYPVVHRFRTGLTVAMFGLVIFSMVVASVLLTGTHRAYSDPAIMAGGFDIRVEAASPSAPDLVGLIATTEAIRPAEVLVTARQIGRNAEAIQLGAARQAWRPVGLHLLDDAFLTNVQAGFVARAPGYADDAAIWRALRDNPGLAVAAGTIVRPPALGTASAPEASRADQFRLDGVTTEDVRIEPKIVWVRDSGGGRSIKLTVIGVLDPRTSFGSGLFAAAPTFEGSAAPEPARTTYLLRVAPGVSTTEKTLAIGLAFADQGFRAAEIGEEVRRIYGVRSLLNELLQGFIGIGLLAGIAGLGVLAFRAVVERRQQIGILRALGYRRRSIQLSFLLEASVVAGIGILIGVALGLGLSYRLVQFLGREYPEIVFSVPWRQIGLIAVIAYGGAMLTTFLPAYQAGRVSPAEALRYE